MPTISLSVSVAANAVSGNVLAGSPFEFISQPSIIILAVTQAGAAASDITADFQIGGESVAQQANVSDRDAFPTFLDDNFVKAGGQAGERLFLNFNNTTAGALVVQVLLDISPL